MKGRSFQGEQYDKRFLTICQVKGSQKKVKRNVARFCQRGPYAASCGADDFPVTAGRLSSSSGAFPRFSGRKDSRSVVGEIKRPSGARGGIRGGIGGCRVPEKAPLGSWGERYMLYLPPARATAWSIASSRMRHEASISSSVIVSGGAMRSAVGQKRNHSVSSPVSSLAISR